MQLRRDSETILFLLGVLGIFFLSAVGLLFVLV